MDYSRHSNNAGAPLPRIPRRVSSSRATSEGSPSLPTIGTVRPETYSTPTKVPTVLVVQPPTPPDVASQTDVHSQPQASSSSSGSDSYVQMVGPRTKRPRAPKMVSYHLPEMVATTCSERIAFPAQALEDSGNETPSQGSSSKWAAHLDQEGLRAPQGEPSSSNRIVSAPHPGAAALVRKKSGEPLRSSLKSRRPLVRGDLSVVTGPPMISSEPSTPLGRSKSVHFDAQLEHVKLFLAEQKPLAVSRDGSPTDDTSGTESDFPSAIYGKKADEDKMLMVQVVNMPLRMKEDADIVLEEVVLSLEGDALNGRIRVRNLSFEKWIAVRFTVDWWQTTSEVTAKYLDSIPGGVFDRFSFTIRLGDMLSRIEDKTLLLALRYNVLGREIWDNNDGQNYKVTFSRVLRPSTSADSGLASLKSKLESVARGQESVGGFMAHHQPRKHTRSEPFTLEASTSLSARYDFATSLKSSWKGSRSPTAGHSRTSTYPHSFPHFPKRGTKMSFDDANLLTRGSPRALESEELAISYNPAMVADVDDSLPPLLTLRKGRNHSRGYFDVGFAFGADVKRTPPTSPPMESKQVPRPIRTAPELLEPTWYNVARGGSAESTPSVTSVSADSTPSPSPSGHPSEPVFDFAGAEPDPRSPVETESYNVFLNKFCFFTGDNSFLHVHPEVMQRSHSASSVEDFLSTPPHHFPVSAMEFPTRSSSYDDVASMSSLSGSVTPTARSLVDAQSPKMVLAH